jgi:hypothetical protein
MFDTLLARVDSFEAARIFFPPYGDIWHPALSYRVLRPSKWQLRLLHPNYFISASNLTFHRGEDHFTDETSELLIWTEINNLIAAITH